MIERWQDECADERCGGKGLMRLGFFLFRFRGDIHSALEKLRILFSTNKLDECH